MVQRRSPVANLQGQIEELKETDGIKCSESVANTVGISVASSCSDALIYLDQQTKNLVNAIINMNNFVKTADYTTAGTYRFTAKGTSVSSIIIGGGGGGSFGVGGSKDTTGASAGGGGGGAGEIKLTGIISVTRGNSYNIVVGTGGKGGIANSVSGDPSAGGTSSAFGIVASGGGAPSRSYWYRGADYGGSGGLYAGGGTYNKAGDGASRTEQSLYEIRVNTGGGGGGGLGACSDNIPLSYIYGGSGGYGSGFGGSGAPYNLHNATNINGNAGGNASSYGSGGGGGGSGSFTFAVYGDVDSEIRGIGGNGGNGKNGRVVIYERGVFSN